MAQPAAACPMSAPGYIVYRDTQPGQPYDPTAPPLFFPPKDSDELFDALRAKYPHLKTHSERMRDAIIDFLIEERQIEAACSSSTSPLMPSLSDTASPWQHSWPSMSSTTLSSPETAFTGTPSFEPSPMAAPPRVTCQPWISTSTESSPAALDQMTSVFSVSTSEQPKQRIRRKMTEAEKIEYRKRRIAKACHKCIKRKRKCTHHQPSVSTVESGNTASRVTKSSTNATKPTGSSRKPAAQLSPSLAFDDPAFNDSFASGADIEGFNDFDDFALFVNRPLAEVDFDDMLHFDDVNSFQFPASASSDNYRAASAQELLSDNSGDWTVNTYTNSSGSPRAFSPSLSASGSGTSHALGHQAPEMSPLAASQNFEHATEIYDALFDNTPLQSMTPKVSRNRLVADQSANGLATDVSPQARANGDQLHSMATDRSPCSLLPVDLPPDRAVTGSELRQSEDTNGRNVPRATRAATGSRSSTAVLPASVSTSTSPSSSVLVDPGDQWRSSPSGKTVPHSTLADAIDRSASPSAELFRLSNGISKVLPNAFLRNDRSAPTPAVAVDGNPLERHGELSPTHTPRQESSVPQVERNAALIPSNDRLDGMACQGNGGAYLRLDSVDQPRPTVGDTLCRVGEAAVPPTRPGVVSTMRLLTRTASDSTTAQGDKPSLSADRQIDEERYNGRKTDHILVQDHHGRRPAALITAWAALLGVLLLGSFSHPVVHPSLLFAALLLPFSYVDGSRAGKGLAEGLSLNRLDNRAARCHALRTDSSVFVPGRACIPAGVWVA